MEGGWEGRFSVLGPIFSSSLRPVIHIKATSLANPMPTVVFLKLIPTSVF